MSIESIEKCNIYLDEHVANLFNKQVKRMEKHNNQTAVAYFERKPILDNPDSIAEELNSILPWVIEYPEVHFENRGGQVVAIRNT